MRGRARKEGMNVCLFGSCYMGRERKRMGFVKCKIIIIIMMVMNMMCGYETGVLLVSDV